MSIETLDDIVEWMADKMSFYGSHTVAEYVDTEKCNCRVCWVPRMKARLLLAYEVEQKLDVGVIADSMRKVSEANMECQKLLTSLVHEMNLKNAEIALLKNLNDSQARSTARLWEILAPDYEGELTIHEIAELVAKKADERPD